MASAAKVYLAEKGEDLARCTLFAFGGGGPLHAVDLMRRMGIERAVVPPRPGVASAFGMSVAPVTYDSGCVYRMPVPDLQPDALDRRFRALEDEARTRLPRFVPQDAVEIQRTVNMRYVGQGYQIPVAVRSMADLAPARLEALFNDEYQRLYGRVDRDQRVEAVSLRVNVNYPQASYRESVLPASAQVPAPRQRQAFCPRRGQMTSFAVHRREHLPPGTRVDGPAIVQEIDSSIVVASGETARVDPSGCVLVSAGT